MTRITMSRRDVLATGTCTLVGAVTPPGLAGASALGGMTNERRRSSVSGTPRGKRRIWARSITCSADKLHPTSAAGDDHISKSTFKARCWETQVDFIGHFDLARITTGAEDAFVKYLCHTKDGKSFRNVEYLRIKNGKLQSIECYFGEQSSFPSAVTTGQK